MEPGLREIAASVLTSRAQAPEPSSTSPIILTNALQIVALSNTVPEGRYEARYQAVIIFVSVGGRRL